MPDIHLAILWHQHQPFYKDMRTGAYAMPWTRLHAIKDYIGMALLLEEFPEVHATINLVPSMIVQLQDYAEGKAEDELLRLTRVPADELQGEERVRFLEHAFVGHPQTIIAPWPRYAELHQKRRPGHPAAADTFTDQDVRDLQVWCNLAWFHAILHQKDAVLRELVRKGRGFTEDDKRAMLRKQTDVIGDVVPVHRRLQESGQIEISTTPFYHPILPLLCDMTVAKVTGLSVPPHAASLRHDARTHVRRALELHESTFGARPRGMWPAEGGVSEDAVALVQDFALDWIATDEEILSRSLGTVLSRDSRGILRQPDVLYQPYLPPGDRERPAILFRDHQLADAVGFLYQRRDARDAVEDFIARIEQSGARCRSEAMLVSVILDGENAWEYYPNNGVDFLRALYGRLARHKRIKTTTPSAYLASHPPDRRLGRLFPGSWINHDFAIWVGTDEDNRAWEQIAAVRAHLVSRIGEPDPAEPDPDKRLAWEQIYIAEGSDWFWWYGDDRNSDDDPKFDALFRGHLKNAYAYLGERPPYFLDEPIMRAPVKTVHTTPRRFLSVTIDGRPTHYFEWADAGHHHVSRTGGAMRRARDPLIHDLYFGFDTASLFIRLDAEREFKDILRPDMRLRIRFLSPETRAVETGRLDAADPQSVLLDSAGERIAASLSMAVDRIFEIGCAVSDLGASPEDPMEFYVELLIGEIVEERVPVRGTIALVVPSEDFEMVMWEV